MYQESADRRYFVIRLGKNFCTPGSKRMVEGTLFTVEPGDFVRSRRTPRSNPWFDRLAVAQCDRRESGRDLASVMAVMEWMMHVVPGRRYALPIRSSMEPDRSDTPADQLVMGRPARGYKMPEHGGER